MEAESDSLCAVCKEVLDPVTRRCGSRAVDNITSLCEGTKLKAELGRAA